MSEGLAERLRMRIERSGPITFAEFMTSALYDPAEGFYERSAGGPAGAVGPDGDFITSPHVSPLFASLLARQVSEIDDLLGGPTPFTIVEAGAGDGTLAQGIIAGLDPGLGSRCEYILAERTSRHRSLIEGLRPRLGVAGRTVEGVADLPPRSVEGCLLANELLDNLPFHLVRGTPHGVVELYVGQATGDSPFALVEGPVSTPEIERLSGPVDAGREKLVPTGVLAFLEAAAAAMRRGYILLIDYAAADDPDGGGTAGVHGYRSHGVVRDVLARPGSSDVTAGVDFGVLAAHAAGLGLRVWGPVTQRDALTALGFAGELEALRRRQVELLDERRGTEAVRSYSDRNRARVLVDSGGLGGFLVLCLGKDVDDRTLRCMALKGKGT